MYPDPPELLSGKGVTDDPVGRTHWVVQHGIRMMGMPSFEGTFSGQDIRGLALLLRQTHQPPASVAEFLRQPDAVKIGADSRNKGREVAVRYWLPDGTKR